MIKAKVDNGKTEMILDGSGIEVMADLCALSHTIVESLEKESGIPAEIFWNSITKSVKRAISESEEIDIIQKTNTASEDIFNLFENKDIR